MCGIAKQLSLSRTTARISTSLSPSLVAFFGNALERGIGRWLNVDTVCCGRQSVGSLSSLKTLSVPEMFIETVGVGRMLGAGEGQMTKAAALVKPKR